MGCPVRPLLATSCLAAALCASFAAAPARAGADDGEPRLVVRNWDVGAGLPSARVFAIAHTPDGYAWLGTYGGLARFDGIAFANFTPDNLPALDTASVTALDVDGAGRLWIGTEEGKLVVRDATGFRRVPAPVTNGRRINAIRSGTDGTLWLGTQDGIISGRDGEWRAHRKADGLETADVAQLALDAAGRPWALAGGSVQAFDGEHWTATTIADVPPGRVSAIAAAAAGGIWCAELAAKLPDGRSSRVIRIHGDGRVEPLSAGPWPRTPARSRIDGLFEDASGRLWCATRGGGVFVRGADGTWREAGIGTTLPRADAIAVTDDPAGGVWIGTRTDGVYQARPAPVRSLRIPTDAGEHVTTTVCARADGSLWAGTDGGGVVVWHGTTARRYGLEEGLPALEIAAVAEDGAGRLFVATARGLARLDGNRFARVDLPGAAGDVTCYCLFIDRQRDVWVGTAQGVFQLRDGATAVMPTADGDVLEVAAFTEDPTGQVIAMSRTGSLHEFGDGRFRHVLDISETASRIRAVAADATGGLWLGTYGGGIVHMAGTTSRRWSMQKHGLPSSHVVGLVAAADAMWVASENGVFGCPIAGFGGATDDATLDTWRITPAEGLPEKGCTVGGQPSVCVARDGTVWVANGRFVAGFDPAAVMRPPVVHPPVVERIVADGMDVAAVGTAVVVLPPGTRRLEFHFSSPNTVVPHALRFRHRLDGFEEKWVEIGDRRIASYTGLPPGEYEFHVEAAAPMAAWQAPAAPTRLRIRPRLWQHRGVQAAAACAAAGLLAAVGWSFERRRSRRREELLRLAQAREQERQRIARDIHDDLGTGLTEIVMLGDIAAREAGDRPGAGTIQHLSERARALTRAMDEVVWAVNPRNDSLEGFITYFHRWAQAYLGKAGLRVRWDLPLETGDAPLGAEARHSLFLACKEAVANVVKHAGAGEVRIRCRADAAGLEIVVADDGRGFTADTAMARGNGLANMRSRLADVAGACEIASTPERGTTVRFFVPAHGPSATA